MKLSAAIQLYRLPCIKHEYLIQLHRHTMTTTIEYQYLVKLHQHDNDHQQESPTSPTVNGIRPDRHSGQVSCILTHSASCCTPQSWPVGSGLKSTRNRHPEKTPRPISGLVAQQRISRRLSPGAATSRKPPSPDSIPSHKPYPVKKLFDRLRSHLQRNRRFPDYRIARGLPPPNHSSSSSSDSTSHRFTSLESHHLLFFPSAILPDLATDLG